MHTLIAKVIDLEGNQVFWGAYDVSLGERSKEEVEATLKEFLDLSKYTEDYNVELKIVDMPDEKKDAEV